MNQIILAVIVMGFLGLFFSIVLGYFSKRFEVKKDDYLEEVIAALPGVNCGACGYPSCEAFAKAFLKGEAPFDGCRVGREKTAEKLKAIKK